MSNLFPNAYVIEIVQLIAALTGVAVSSWALWDASKDKLVLLRAGQNGAKELLVKGSIRSELKNIGVFVLYVIMGVSGVLLGPPFPLDQESTFSAAITFLQSDAAMAHAIREQRAEVFQAMWIVRSCLIAATAWKLYDSLAERRDRRKHVEYWRQGGEERRGTAADRRHDTI